LAGARGRRGAPSDRGCGLVSRSAVAVASAQADPELALEDVVGQLSQLRPHIVLAFHGSRFRSVDVSRALQAACPDALTVGCTTAGEVGPLGLTVGGISVLALMAPARGAASWLASQGATSFAYCQEAVARCAAQLGLTTAELSPDRHVLITLTAPFGGGEDRQLAAIADAAPGVPIIGGSAGDDFRWQQTWAFRGADVQADCGLVLLLEPGVPFHGFAVHHFFAESRRVVVTGVDEREPRRVKTLNGWPAFEEYVRLAGLDTPEKVAACRRSGQWPVQLGFRLAGAVYVRAIMTEIEGDLLLGGAVEEGMVLCVLGANDLVEATQQGVARAIATLGAQAPVLLLFNCGGRLLQAREEDLVGPLWAAMHQAPSAGFSTYGEQFGPVQVSYTLSGLVLGTRADP
jgi:hypothetical protein